jgi:deoxycytidylate deaminase
MDIYSIIDSAVMIACRSQYKQRLGAVLLNRGKVIAVGHNKVYTEPVYPGYFSVHAECDVLKKGVGDCLCVIRLLNSDLIKLGMARPCYKCMKRIKKSGVKVLYFSNWNGDIEMLKL